MNCIQDPSMSSRLEEKPSLIIISGLPRSGTTWLGKLFDSHPRTLYRHEPDSVRRLEGLPLIVEGDYGKYASPLRDFVSQLPKVQDPKVSASLPVFTKAFMGPVQQLLVKPSLYMVKALSSTRIKVKVPRYCIPKEGQDYVLVWKTIESTGRLGLYAEALDKKRIIHVLRHPCATISSRLRGERLNKFGGYRSAEDHDLFRILIESSVGQRSGLSLDRIEAMRPIERLAWKCVTSLEKAFEDLEGRPDCKIITYEDLCTKPLEILQQLFDFCGLNFDSQTHRFLTESTSRKEKKYYSVFKDPLESAYKWKRELDAGDQKLVRKQLERSPLVRFWPD